MVTGIASMSGSLYVITQALRQLESKGGVYTTALKAFEEGLNLSKALATARSDKAILQVLPHPLPPSCSLMKCAGKHSSYQAKSLTVSTPTFVRQNRPVYFNLIADANRLADYSQHHHSIILSYHANPPIQQSTN
jgi:hypothetical protein